MPVAPDTATLYGPNGEEVTIPHEPITEDEIRLLVAYKQFLHRHQYREALYCNRCWSGNREDGTSAHVQINGLTVEALVKCRCRISYGKGGGLAS